MLLFSLFGNFEEEVNPYDSQIDRIQEEFITEVQKKKRCDVFMTGRACPDAIRQISVGFASNDVGTIETARRDIVWLGQTLLKKLNSDLRIRPYLYVFPCNNENINIKIMFENPRNSHEQKIDFVELYNNRIDYISNDNPLRRPEYVFSETFDQAIQKVELEKN